MAIPADRAGAATERRLLGLLGLAARAGYVAAGTDAVRRGVRDGKIRTVVIASDAATGQRQKLVPLLRARGIDHFTLSTREALGDAIGRAPVTAVGWTDVNFARRARELAAAAAGAARSNRSSGDVSPQD